MISIIMPLYNGEEFLNESIPSIINQTFSNWELIIGINGLPIKKARDIHQKIKLFKNKKIKTIVCVTKGKSKTLNALTWHANNDIICTIDVDDKWELQKLEKQLPLMNKYDIVGTNVEYFGNKTGSPDLFLGKLSEPMFTYQNPIINSSIMMRKCDAWWDPQWEGLDDYNLWIELLKLGRKFYNIPEILTYHRIHENSYFNNKNYDINLKLLKEKVKKISPQERANLVDIIDNKKWIL